MAFRDITSYFDKPLFEWIPKTEVTLETGYTSQLRSLSTNPNVYEIVKLPFETNTSVNTDKLVLNGDVLAGYVLVIISFWCLIQALKGLVWSWIS